MATWSTDSADFIKALNQEEYQRQKAAEQLVYDRQRQAVADQRAQKNFDLKYAADLRNDALAQAQHKYTMDTLAETQKLDALVRQKKLNDLAKAQRDSDYSKAEDKYKMESLAKKQELDNLTRQNQIDTQRNAALQKDFYSRTYTPYQEALLKLKANGGNINALSDAEKDAIQQEIGYMIDEEAGQQFVSDVRNATPEYMKGQGVNPDFVPLYAREQRAAAAKNAEYERKNAPAIAKQKQQEQYNTVSGYMTGFYNDAVKSGSIDPKVAKSKDIVDAATRIFIASNGSLTPKQAFYQAAGIKGAQSTNGNSKTEWLEKLDTMYGGLFREADAETQEKLIKVAQEMQPEIDDMLIRSGKSTLAELGLNQLRILDRLWKNKVKDDDYYSPFQDEIFLRERDDLYYQKSPLIAELRELEKKHGVDYKDSPYNMQEHRNNALPEYEKKKRLLRNKIDTINNYIKMREKKLSARGIKFKEYK